MNYVDFLKALVRSKDLGLAIETARKIASLASAAALLFTNRAEAAPAVTPEEVDKMLSELVKSVSAKEQTIIDKANAEIAAASQK